MSAELIRLSKLMSQRGLCSRREADDFIARGLVRVNGEIVAELGTKVAPDAVVTLATQAARQQQSLVTIALHKPIGYVSAQPEPPYEPALKLIVPANQFQPQDGPRFQRHHLKGLAVAGRLDIDSQGLLLFTQDGRVARRLVGAEHELEKEYLVRVGGALPAEKLELLRYGLTLDGKRLERAQVAWLNQDQLRFVLHEGRKRQLRRMCEAVGLRVMGLKRVRIGRLRLGNLPEGKWRFVEPGELLD